MWADPWFYDLLPEYKLVMRYLYDQCCWGGIYQVNLHKLEQDCGFYRWREPELINRATVLDYDDFLRAVNAEEPRIIVKGKKWWLVKFIQFHCFSPEAGRVQINKQLGLHRGMIDNCRKNGFGAELEKYYGDCIVDKKVRSTLPDMADILKLAEAKGVPEAELRKFYNHYQSKGWKAGGDRITDVGARLRLWLDQSQQRAEQSQPGGVEDLRQRVEDLIALREQMRADPKNLEKPSGDLVGSLKPEIQAKVALLTKEIVELESKLPAPVERFPKFKK